jgi:hypothetical protein
MPADLLLGIAAPGVKTATFNTSGVTLPKGSTWNELFLRVPYTAASNASGANSVTFDVDISYDNASTWTELAGEPPINLSTTVQSGVVFIPIVTTRQDLINAAAANAPQVRLTGTFAGAGSTPTITVAQCDFMPTRD